MNKQLSFTEKVLRLLLLALVVFFICGLILYFNVFNLLPTALIACVVFFGLLLFNRQSEIFRDLKMFKVQSGSVGEFEHDINRRLDALEQQLQKMSSQPAPTDAPRNDVLFNQVEVLRHRLDAVESGVATGFQSLPADQPLIGPQKPPGHSFNGMLAQSATGVSRINLKDALSNDKLTMHLQPIVALPTRAPLHFEALMRLQGRNGEFIEASRFLKIAEKGGLISTIDKKVLFSSIRMLRTLKTLKKRAGLFCNLSAHTLSQTRDFREIFDFLQANVALKDSLVIEISQRQFRHLKKRERDRLVKIADLGFSLSLDQALDLRFDLETLKAAGIRFIKIPTGILLHANLDDDAPAAPSELAYEMAQHDITLVATEVERENEVMSLIDFGVQSAQGMLFAPPRPVKEELLNPTSSRSRPSSQPPVKDSETLAG